MCFPHQQLGIHSRICYRILEYPLLSEHSTAFNETIKELMTAPCSHPVVLVKTRYREQDSLAVCVYPVVQCRTPRPWGDRMKHSSVQCQRGGDTDYSEEDEDKQICHWYERDAPIVWTTPLECLCYLSIKTATELDQFKVYPVYTQRCV